LTFGAGLNDEDLVEQVAEALAVLDSSIHCVVLENPSMVGQRRQSFYRRLLRFSNVTIADPTVPTQWLTKNSMGLLTISGTAALEASIHGIPVHVVGRPDYLACIASHGLSKVAGFLENCIAGKGPVSRAAVLSYLESNSKERWRGQLGWAAVSPETTAITTWILLDMFKSKNSGGSNVSTS
jgi:hypothetical protein